MRPGFGFAASAAVCVLTPPAFLAAQGPSSPLERRVDSLYSAFSSTRTPGCAIGVDQRGAPLLRRAYGMANLETASPFTISTISESGSTAKQFVAAGLVLLARDGVLSLGDDVSRWVPEVKGVGKRISVRHLLSHTSGLPDRYTLHDVEGRAAGDVDHTNAEVLDVVSHLRELNFDPGEDYLYSNTGYVVAVALLERASGKSLQQFTNERIFAPLGMTDTRWREDHRVVVTGRASAYSGSIVTGFRNDHPFTRVFGSGGLLLTIDDFLKWSAALQAGTGAWGAVRDSLESIIRLNDGTTLTYGLGVVTDQWRGVRRVSHTGATGGYRAALYRYPAQSVSIAILCNGASANTTVMAGGVANAVLGDALAPVAAATASAVTITGDVLASIAGRYHSPRTDDVLILEVRNGQLVDSISGAALLPLSGDRFRLGSSESTLRVTRTTPAVMLSAEAQGSRTVEYVRVDAPLPSFTNYSGRYRSPELDAVATLAMRGDTLVMDQSWRGTVALKPLFRDGFALPSGERLRFTRDARGRLTGYAVWAGRVRHLRFDRLPPR